VRTKLSIFMEEKVYPQLYERLPEIFPEFGFVNRGDKYEATLWPDNFPVAVDNPRPERIQCYANAPWMFHLHGRWSMLWLVYVNKGKPLAGVFEVVCEFLAKKVDVPFPDRQMTEEEREQARRWEERKTLLGLIFTGCQAYLFSPAGTAARNYMTATRGFTEADLKNLEVGLYPPADFLWNSLTQVGFDPKIAEECGVFDERMCGYVVVPWYAASGAPLSLYGRWPDKDLPLQKDLPGWKWKRDKALKEWGALTDAQRAATPWVEPKIPKTKALAGDGTKSSPLFSDRAIKAGTHKHLIGVEGLLDASMLQARGETRAVVYVAATFSKEQIQTLVRYGVKYVTIVPDPDGGGTDGCLNSLENLREAGITTFVAQLPVGLDPDEYVIKYGIDAFRALVQNAQPGSEYEIEGLLSKVNKDSPAAERQAARDQAIDATAKIDEAGARERVIKIIARKLGDSIGAVRKDVDAKRKTAQAQAKTTKTATATGAGDDDKPYIIEDGCLAKVTWTRDGSTTTKLCNVTAEIKEEVTRDDGAEKTLSFVIEGRLATGKPLSPIEVSVEAFSRMDWPLRHWGNQVLVNAGLSIKDHLRAAISNSLLSTFDGLCTHTRAGYRSKAFGITSTQVVLSVRKGL
jgi:hypothetical protein